MRRDFEEISKAAVFGIAILALGAGAVQTIAAQTDDGGQPARAVRLSDVEGQVTRLAEWPAACRPRPGEYAPV